MFSVQDIEFYMGGWKLVSDFKEREERNNEREVIQTESLPKDSAIHSNMNPSPVPSRAIDITKIYKNVEFCRGRILCSIDDASPPNRSPGKRRLPILTYSTSSPPFLRVCIVLALNAASASLSLSNSCRRHSSPAAQCLTIRMRT